MAIIEQTEGRLLRLAEAGNTGGGLQTLCEVLRKAAGSARLTFNHDGSVTGGLRGLGASVAGWVVSSLRTS
jgi:hypothetical protein